MPVPRHLCALAYDDDGCRVGGGGGGDDLGACRAGSWIFPWGRRCSSGGTPCTPGTGGSGGSCAGEGSGDGGASEGLVVVVVAVVVKITVVVVDIVVMCWLQCSVMFWHRNDIEQVSVRAGCSFTGFNTSTSESYT